ncbi:MAG: RluA family pseudouridine synthase [Patescibacteria group bacterium]
MELNILYEDNHLIAVFKPAGLLTQGDRTGDQSIFALTKRYIKAKYHKPGNVYLGLIHRLDRPASGIIIFAKTSKAASRLSEQLRCSLITKKYLAAVEGKMGVGDKQVLIQYLQKNEQKNITRVSNISKPGYKKSILEYQVKTNAKIQQLKKSSPHLSSIISNSFSSVPKQTNTTFLDIHLITGRSHQIRAQLSSINHPIIGDIKYGAATPLPNKNIALIAYELSFYHPITKKQITISL